MHLDSMQNGSSEQMTWQLAPTYILQTIELFNWGGFNGLHQADIDASGTAIIGPTGSGKTTLVDALMTLITANPKYNLASTGGHESDRDLASYVRGVSGPGTGGDAQSHIARTGKTVTALSATLSNGENVVRLGAMLWFDGTSTSPSDMKKLWLFSTSADHTLQRWLTLHHEGGMRALRQLDKTETAIWTYPSKKAFLARVRDFFEVRDNAFNLLNRAAGLKQLNSIDEIFRELVLDDKSQFARAREVADSFNDLTAIHDELEIARRQQRSLEPIKTTWQKYQENELVIAEKVRLQQILPIWLGEQGYRIWKAEAARLADEHSQAEAARNTAQEDYDNQLRIRDQLNEAYLRLGGSDIQTLENLIREKQSKLDRCNKHATQYQQLVRQLDLPEEIHRETVAANQTEASTRLEQIEQDHEDAKQTAFEHGSQRFQANKDLQALKEELADIETRPSSNIRRDYQLFRSLLAEELAISESELPFVGELIQVKPEDQHWRGAIERAIGSHRLRILVPKQAVDGALRWVNSRHNALHVRILEVALPEKSVHFFEDGFTRKLQYKDHPYREAVKDLLAGLDRHCVDSPTALRHTPHAMTVEGLLSGRARFFDKQDQKRLQDDWQTGFNNRDRLASLTQQIAETKEQLTKLAAEEEKAKGRVAVLHQQISALHTLASLDYNEINTPQAKQELEEQKSKLQALIEPGSDASAAKAKLDAANVTLTNLDTAKTKHVSICTRIESELNQAEKAKTSAYKRAELGMKDDDRKLAESQLPMLSLDQVHESHELERKTADELQVQLNQLNSVRTNMEKQLVGAMSDAQREDRGALAEVGRDLEDIPKYLQRLTVLTEEALPEKQQRFKDYLTRSSDDGVSQLLSTIDGEVERIEERLDDLNHTLRLVDFERGRYLQLVANKVVHESLRTFTKARNALNSSRLTDDGGESQYKALQYIISLLHDACERHRTLGARALLDPRFRLEFKVAIMDRSTGNVIATRTGSQGGSGGEKEIIASYVLTASLSYALCPDGSSRPLFGTIVLDEAFSRSSNAVAGRIIAALKEFHLHALFITPNKEMRLLRKHTRSAVIVHRRGNESNLTPISWQALDAAREQRRNHEIPN
ncbi:ATP-binding protein [Spongiibacter nanhainus]